MKRLCIALVAGAIALSGCATTSQADTCARLTTARTAAIAIRDASLSLMQNADDQKAYDAAYKAWVGAVATIAGIDGACPIDPANS